MQIQFVTQEPKLQVGEHVTLIAIHGPSASTELAMRGIFKFIMNKLNLVH